MHSGIYTMLSPTLPLNAASFPTSGAPSFNGEGNNFLINSATSFDDETKKINKWVSAYTYTEYM